MNLSKVEKSNKKNKTVSKKLVLTPSKDNSKKKKAGKKANKSSGKKKSSNVMVAFTEDDEILDMDVDEGELFPEETEEEFSQSSQSESEGDDEDGEIREDVTHSNETVNNNFISSADRLEAGPSGYKTGVGCNSAKETLAEMDFGREYDPEEIKSMRKFAKFLQMSGFLKTQDKVEEIEKLLLKLKVRYPRVMINPILQRLLFIKGQSKWIWAMQGQLTQLKGIEKKGKETALHLRKAF